MGMTEFKVCSRCKENKQFKLFGPHKGTKDKLDSWCKPCKKQWTRERYLNNKDKIKEANSNWLLKNQERVKNRRKEYRLENKQNEKLYRKQYHEKNKERVRARKKLYRKNNQEKIKSQRKLNSEKRKFKRNSRLKLLRQENLQFKLQENLRSRLYKAVVGLTKAGSAVQDLGCTFEELKQHLQAKFYGNMSWGNYGSYWVIDHIIPLAVFDLADREQFLKAAHYTNLQPLTKEHNQIKLDKIMTMDEIEILKSAGG